MVKGDRQKGSQVSPTTQILVHVKVDRWMGFQVSPTATQILALFKGSRQLGFQVDQATHRDIGSS
jgi:hypothetical protein